MSLSDDLDAIYSQYPRKKAPRYAKLCIQRALKRLESGEDMGVKLSHEKAVTGLLAATQAFASSPEGNKGTYTPHPATWYNRASYLESPQEWHRETPKPESAGLARNNRNASLIAEAFRERTVSDATVLTLSEGFRPKRTERLEAHTGQLLFGRP